MVSMLKYCLLSSQNLQSDKMVCTFLILYIHCQHMYITHIFACINDTKIVLPVASIIG